MRTRIVYTKIWKDSFYSSLTTIEKLLFVYFITNEYVNIVHLYELPERVILFDTGVSKQELDNAKNKFEANRKIYFYKDFVYLANARRYESYIGDKNEKAKTTLYGQLSKDVLDWYYSIPDTPKIGVYIPPINHKSEIINHKSEISRELFEKKRKELQDKRII